MTGALTSSNGWSCFNNSHSLSSRMNLRSWTPSRLLNWAMSQREKSNGCRVRARPSISATEFHLVGTERRSTCSLRLLSTHSFASSSRIVGEFATFFERFVIWKIREMLVYSTIQIHLRFPYELKSALNWYPLRWVRGSHHPPRAQNQAHLIQPRHSSPYQRPPPRGQLRPLRPLAHQSLSEWLQNHRRHRHRLCGFARIGGE